MTKQNPECHALDKLGLFILGGAVITVLGLIVAGAFWAERGGKEQIDGVLVGGIATGLILFLRDIVGAIRAGWEEVTRGRMNDQLARSTPNAEGPVPADAAAAGEQVALAAEEEAARISGAVPTPE